jgi:hypothetical protein
MGESELLEGNRFVRGIKKINDRLFAMVRLYDQLMPAHVTLAVALSLDLSRHRKASLIPISRLWGPAAIEWPSFTQRCMRSQFATSCLHLSARAVIRIRRMTLRKWAFLGANS